MSRKVIQDGDGEPVLTVMTTENAGKPKVMTPSQLNAEQRKIERAFGDEEKVEVTMPIMVSSGMGNPFCASLNGVPFTLVAGVPKKLPKSMADWVNTVIVNTR